MSGQNPRKCRQCDRMVYFLTAENGKIIPCDMVAPVYRNNEDGTCTRVRDHFVSHFSTCPKAPGRKQ